jgi:hypothetical protein
MDFQMKADQIQSGEFYKVKTPVTGEIVTRVFARQNDSEFPFEISAARLGVKAEEIFPLTK